MRYALLVLIALAPGVARAQGQSGMNQRADRRARAADSTLNVVYERLVAQYRVDSVALRKLRVAERAWIAFRDAEIDATYPAADQQRYGSVFPMCAASLFEELTRARIAQLRRALHPAEGDVCAGGPV